ncbi:MAG: peptidoglycan-binding domain-containing protein, partial [Patescibacteria group bacterium]
VKLLNGTYLSTTPPVIVPPPVINPPIVLPDAPPLILAPLVTQNPVVNYSSNTNGSANVSTPGSANYVATSTTSLCPNGKTYSSNCGLTTYATNTTATQYNFGYINLGLWSRGEEVKELQRFLNRKAGSSLLVDGVLGPLTTASVKKWQTDNALMSDGIIGPKTMTKMYSL